MHNPQMIHTYVWFPASHNAMQAVAWKFYTTQHTIWCGSPQWNAISPIFTQACNAVTGRHMQSIAAALDLVAMRGICTCYAVACKSRKTLRCVALRDAGNQVLAM